MEDTFLIKKQDKKIVNINQIGLQKKNLTVKKMNNWSKKPKNLNEAHEGDTLFNMVKIHTTLGKKTTLIRDFSSQLNINTAEN